MKRELEVTDFLKSEIIFEDMQTIFSSRESWQELNNKKIYISGATGMIASYMVMFLIYLNEIKHYHIEIYAGARSRNKLENRFGKYIKSYYFYVVDGDVCNFNLDARIDFIIHAAGLASPQYYGKSPVETMLPNIIGTYQLLEYARHNNIESFLFFSSGAVYGEIENVPIITETSCGKFEFLDPGSVYGESKRCGEALCSAYCREYSVSAKSVRIHHIYGPTLDLENDKRAFSEFVKNIIDNQDIVLMSDGRQKRAFCYITDGIIALFKVLLDGENNTSYNLANSKQFVSIKQLAEMLISLCPNKNLKVIFKERTDEGYLNLAQTSFINCSTEKIQKLGCEFNIDIKEGFKRTIDYFISCQKG